jgi:hypothetical protein
MNKATARQDENISHFCHKRCVSLQASKAKCFAWHYILCNKSQGSQQKQLEETCKVDELPTSNKKQDYKNKCQ